MMDEYEYKTLELPAKNQGLFGIGGMPNSEGIGFTGRVIDSSGGFSGNVGGILGQDGMQGDEGPRGDPGVLFPGAKKGDMAYWSIGVNFEGWDLLRAPAGGGGVFSVKDGYPQWIEASEGSIIIGNNSDSLWDYSILGPPPNNGKEYALGRKEDNMEWIEITSCPELPQ